MPIALVTHATGGNANSFTTAGINTTGANFLTISITCFSVDPALAAISDSKGNTWIPITSRFISGSEANSVLFYAWNATVGSGHTVTVNCGAGSFASASFASWSGVKSSANPLDQQNGQIVNSARSSYQPNTGITPSSGSSLIICVCGSGGTSSSGFSINSSFITIDLLNYAAGINEANASAYLIQGAAALINPTWSWTAGNSASAFIVNFLSPSTAYTSSLSDTYTFAETIAKRTTRSVSDTLTLIETISKGTGRSVSEVFTLVETISRALGKSFNDTISLIETFAKAKRTDYITVLSDLFTLAENVNLNPTIQNWAYLRNYLSDPELITGPSTSDAETSLTHEDLEYFKRYL